MASRIFKDPAGTLWTVWDVIPGTHNPGTRQLQALPEEMSGGWLCFESLAGKRRLYPIPAGWEELSEDRLDLLCRSAFPVGRSRSAHERDPAPASDPGTEPPPDPSPEPVPG